ncbi:MAG: hypothetical protein IJV21_02555, partial [Lachnospiraceae bacterium]|nr:hypothetical protein [Lachnospiraceae bacterium]
AKDMPRAWLKKELLHLRAMIPQMKAEQEFLLLPRLLLSLVGMEWEPHLAFPAAKGRKKLEFLRRIRRFLFSMPMYQSLMKIPPAISTPETAGESGLLRQPPNVPLAPLKGLLGWFNSWFHLMKRGVRSLFVPRPQMSVNWVLQFLRVRLRPLGQR